MRHAMFTEIFRAQRREGRKGRGDWLPELISELLRTRTGEWESVLSHAGQLTVFLAVA